MALEPLDQRHLQAADGFIELGMFEEANARLEELDPFLRSVFEVLIRRLAIYHGLKKWDLMPFACGSKELPPMNEAIYA
jgi:hypothetical protein